VSVRVCLSVVCVSGETFDDVIPLYEIARLQEKSAGGSGGRAEGSWVCVRDEGTEGVIESEQKKVQKKTVRTK
jgi:hypothetical protein